MTKEIRGFRDAIRIYGAGDTQHYGPWKVYKLPVRASENSSRYILSLSESVTIPSAGKQVIGRGLTKLGNKWYGGLSEASSDETSSDGICGCKPTILHTGIKAYMQKDEYLKVTLGISDIKHAGLILINGEKIYSSDDYSNQKDDGEINLEVLNLMPWSISLKHGEPIAYAVFQKILKADQDIVLK